MIKTPYEDLLRDVLENGVACVDRTGVGTFGVFGRQIRYDLAEGFPLVTTKKVFTRGVFAELLWLLSGDTNEHTLRDQGVNIWREWADEDGELGPIYGHQWRNWGGGEGWDYYSDEPMTVEGVDQTQALLDGLREEPFSRRHIVSAWNVEQLPDMALPPCHTLFQFHVSPDAEGNPERLNLQLYQRSADLFLGVPFNIASYAALQMMVAQHVGLKPGEFVHTFGDAHIYMNHIDQVREQLSREARPYPTLTIAARGSIFDHKLEDFEVVGYDPHPAIKAPVAV